MPLIAGLGNPGDKYEGTRHNVGFEVVDLLADFLKITFKPGKGPYYFAKGSHKGQKLILIKPTTYMNRSGEAVTRALNWYKIPTSECLVCYDDLDLPTGKIRIRPGGSAGSHNGMTDVVNMLGTTDFPRLRIGIGNDFREGSQVGYVLSRFTSDERKLIDKAINNARDAILYYVREGIDATMNKFN